MSYPTIQQIAQFILSKAPMSNFKLNQPDSFKKFMGYDHTTMVIIIMILAVTAFSTFLVAGINISELIIDPKVAFIRSLFTNN